MGYVFISHSRDDAVYARRLVRVFGVDRGKGLGRSR